jgi:hypothetical protein
MLLQPPFGDKIPSGDLLGDADLLIAFGILAWLVTNFSRHLWRTSGESVSDQHPTENKAKRQEEAASSARRQQEAGSAREEARQLREQAERAEGTERVRLLRELAKFHRERGETSKAWSVAQEAERINRQVRDEEAASSRQDADLDDDLETTPNEVFSFEADESTLTIAPAEISLKRLGVGLPFMILAVYLGHVAVQCFQATHKLYAMAEALKQRLTSDELSAIHADRLNMMYDYYGNLITCILCSLAAFTFWAGSTRRATQLGWAACGMVLATMLLMLSFGQVVTWKEITVKVALVLLCVGILANLRKHDAGSTRNPDTRSSI